MGLQEEIMSFSSKQILKTSFDSFLVRGGGLTHSSSVIVVFHAETQKD